jgi:DNA-binding transcriptional LysR family regulator
MTTLDAMEPRLLRAFVAVAEELHFGRAARRLHISQPPLSVQIRTLEERLGARLFDRDRRHVVLTEAGAFFLERARYHLREAELSCSEAIRIARGEAGVLAIGYTPTATYEVLPRALARFRAEWPEIRLELRELRSAQQGGALREGRIEVGLACGPLAFEHISEHVLATESFVAALPEAHRLARRRGLTLSDLRGEPCVQVRPDIEPAWAGACQAELDAAGVALAPVQETDSKIALLGLVAAGVGLAIVSESMQRLARDGVVYRPLVDMKRRVPLVGLVGAEPSLRAQHFLEACRSSRAPRPLGRARHRARLDRRREDV